MFENNFSYKPYSIGILLVLAIVWMATMLATQKELFPWWFFVIFWIIELIIGTFIALVVMAVWKGMSE